MTALELAILSDNKLVGHLPDSLVQRQAGGAYVNIARNYLTGTTARAIYVNLDNFIDGASTMQNRMYLDDYIQIAENQERNIYSLFVTRDAADIERITDKAKLPPESYRLEISMNTAQTEAILDHYEAASLNELVFLRTDPSGLYIQVLKALETEYPIMFSLSIIHNDGSIYSRTLFRVTSAVPPTPPPAGGGGGGGLIWLEPEEKPPVVVNPPPVIINPAAPLSQTIQILTGYPDDTVRPNGSLTREEAARILFNLQAPEMAYPYNGQYRDVDKARWSASAIGHLSVLGVVRGYPDGLFRPGEPITRAEFVTLLRGYLPVLAPTEGETEDEPVFKDIAGHWARGYIEAAYAQSVISGYPDGRFAPDQPITRAEAVTVLLRLSGRLPNPALSNPFADLSPDHWAYGAILEAARGQTYQPAQWAVPVQEVPEAGEDETEEDALAGAAIDAEEAEAEEAAEAIEDEDAAGATA
jgi:hypothetical protein